MLAADRRRLPPTGHQTAGDKVFKNYDFNFFFGGESLPKPSKTEVDFFSARDPCQDLSEGVADEWFQVAAAARRCLLVASTLSTSECPDPLPTTPHQAHQNQFQHNPCFGETLCVVQQCGTGVVSVWSVVVQ